MHSLSQDLEWNTPETRMPIDKIRVMIIDEHLAVRRALAARLAAFSNIDVVATARSYYEGLQKVRECSPDVILLELKGVSGQETDPVGEMRKATAGDPVGIIVLTSYADDDEQQAAIAAGAQRYLLKHIDSSQLTREIEAVRDEIGHRDP